MTNPVYEAATEVREAIGHLTNEFNRFHETVRDDLWKQPRLVRLTHLSDDKAEDALVNPHYVAAITRGPAGYVTLRLTSGQQFWVKGSLDEVAAKLGTVVA